MSNSPFQKPIDIKISTVVAVSAILHSTDCGALDTALHDMTGGAADFFEGDLAVIDAGALAAVPDAMDWAGLIALLRKYQLNPVAVRNAAPDLVDTILAHGLSLDTGKREEEQPAPAASAPAPGPSRTLIVDTPVRAGQRIYARGGDLIVTAVVNNGAELIADGSIHVYNTLNGRALAGASGNAQARIFAMSMSPELVSIAGVYRTFEDGFPAELAKRPVQISLVGDRIDILSVTTPTRA